MASQRIMLVDNEEGLCRMMEAVLRDQGYTTKSFPRPVQAVAEFSAGDYDLIISDIKMPEMDGLEVLQHIRNRDPEVPVIMITAFGSVDGAVDAMRFTGEPQDRMANSRRSSPLLRLAGSGTTNRTRGALSAGRTK